MWPTDDLIQAHARMQTQTPTSTARLHSHTLTHAQNKARAPVAPGRPPAGPAAPTNSDQPASQAGAPPSEKAAASHKKPSLFDEDLEMSVRAGPKRPPPIKTNIAYK